MRHGKRDGDVKQHGVGLSPSKKAQIVETALRVGSVNKTAQIENVGREAVTRAIVMAGLTIADIKLVRQESPRYTGPIRCGQRFSPQPGFVWDLKGDHVRFYAWGTDPRNPHIDRIPLSQVRRWHLVEDNPEGTLLVGACH